MTAVWWGAAVIFTARLVLQVMTSKEDFAMVVEINENNFAREVSSSDKLVLVDFWAPWCNSCKMLSPVIEELAVEYEGRVKIGKVNTDENTSLSAKFQISSIPCLILFKNGETLHKTVGFRSKNDIKKSIDDNAF
jgi:thioredoxin 1